MQIENLKTELKLPYDVAKYNKKLQEHQKDARKLRKSKMSYETGVALEWENTFIKLHKEMGEEKDIYRFWNIEVAKKIMKLRPSAKKTHAGPLIMRALVPLKRKEERRTWDWIWRNNRWQSNNRINPKAE